ncbi:hypothetical protein KIW84_044012 [Lathyrus oleraceus]|uniref:Chromo domain-containing protein n=1 Tax=Pisum sativum TaxID=3888 RepID=A0A9D5AVB2_PEA|nr:hypothetical protein KIW84_044012 [Pisum sativum]
MMLKEMKEQLLKAQDVMRSQANKQRRQVDYEVREMVFLKIQPYKMKKLAKRVNQKLSPRYHGPYEILQKIGAVAYKLKLPEDTRWHLEPTPEKVLDARTNEQGGVEVLVKWKNLPDFENSWELRDRIRTEFPSSLLEVKESFEGGRIGRYGKCYERTRKKREGERLTHKTNSVRVAHGLAMWLQLRGEGNLDLRE